MDTKFHKVAPWAALALVIGLMTLAWLRQTRSGERRIHGDMQVGIGQVENVLELRLQHYQEVLHDAAAFYASERPGPAAWRRYVTSLHLEEKSPALYGIGFAAYIPENHRDRDMKISPSGSRFDYFVVQSAEPHDRNGQLIGFDLGSDISARSAAERARNLQNGALTGKITLPDDASSRSFLFFYPVFRDESFQGWVFGRFHEEEMLKGLLVDMSVPPALFLQVYEGPAMTRDALFFDSSAPLTSWQRPNASPMTVVKGFQAAGRTWTLNFTPQDEAGNFPSGGSGAAGLVPLLALSLLILAAALLWNRMYARAEGLAREMAVGMRQRERALTLGPYGMIICDATTSDWPVVYVNRAFEKITGYSAQEVLGRNCRFLEGTDRDQKGLVELRRALKENRDCRVLLRNYRKDGTPFWNDLFVSPVRNDMGRVVQMVAIQHDVTEREQTSRRLATEASLVRALAESPSLYEAAPRVLQAICEAQEWDFGTFWRMDPRTNTLQCVDQWHSLDLDLHELEDFMRQTTLTRDMGVPGTVWGKGEQIWLPDLSRDNPFPESKLAVQSGLISACGFPIANRRGVVGVLVFYSRRIWPLSKNLMLLMVGAGAQISQYMEREHLQIEQKEISILERGLAEFMGEGLIAMDREGYCIYMNATAGRMLGHPPKIILGQNVHEIVHASTPASVCDPEMCPLVRSLQSTRPIYVDDRNTQFRRKDRQLLPVAYTVSPIVDKDLIQGVVLTFVDVTARRAEEEKLRRALEEKEEEIKNIQLMLSETREVKNQPTSGDLLVDKIRKLLG